MVPAASMWGFDVSVLYHCKFKKQPILHSKQLSECPIEKSIMNKLVVAYLSLHQVETELDHVPQSICLVLIRYNIITWQD